MGVMIRVFQHNKPTVYVTYIGVLHYKDHKDWGVVDRWTLKAFPGNTGWQVVTNLPRQNVSFRAPRL